MSKIIHLRQLRLVKDSKEVRKIKADLAKVKDKIRDLESKVFVLEDRLCDEATKIEVAKFDIEEPKQIVEGIKS